MSRGLRFGENTPIFGKPGTPSSSDGRRAATIGRALSRNLVLVTVVLVGLLHIGNALLVSRFESATADREGEAREAEATLFAEHASRAVTAIGLTLESIREKLPVDFAAEPPSILNQVILEAHMRELPQVRAFIVLDATGQVTYDTRQFPPTPRNLSDRPYFVEQMTGRAMGLYIGQNDIARWDKKPFFAISLPINDAAGKFRGVITALADPTYFSSVYGTRGLEPGVSAILVRDGGAILAGTSPAIATGTLSQRLQQLKAVDRQTAVITRRVPSLPLQIVLVGPSPSASTAFHSFLRADIIIMLAVTAIALLLARILAIEAAARSRAETLLREALDNVPAGIALYDRDDLLLLCNERYRQMAVESVRRLIVPGAAFAEILAAAAAALKSDPAIAGTAEDYVAERMARYRTGQNEVVQKLPGGPWVISRDRLTDAGVTITCHTDISSMKQQEQALRLSEQAERAARRQAEQADQAKSAFLATISHELRTPLNAVIGFSEIIDQEMFGSISARYHEYNALILRSGQHLLAVINDILDVAKLQSGTTELHRAPTYIGDLVEDVLRIMTKQAESGEITLDAEIEPQLAPMTVDATRLRQVMLNLLSNAIKFTLPGGTVTVIAARHGDILRLEVRDTGIGMSEQDIPKALEPFGQIDNAMTRTREGTGLGLPLAKSLVELHGGTFEISSTPGVGTTIAIDLPMHGATTTLPAPLRNVG